MNKAYEILNKAAKELYAYIESKFQEHPGKKMVFSHPVGCRNYTQIAPFETYEKCESTGEWVKVDSGKGIGHLMALVSLCIYEGNLYGEKWCNIEPNYFAIEELTELIVIIDRNDQRKKLKSMDPKKFSDRITFDWVDNDMAEKHR